MRVCDISESEIVVGMKIRSLVDPNRVGVIVKVDDCAWIQWPNEQPNRFYPDDCECQIVELV